MSQAVSINAPDLRKEFPRSPNALVGPYVLLGRVLDKCRAVIAGTNGEYNFNCPLDQIFFNFFALDAEAFMEEVAKGKTDADMLDWVNTHVTKSEDEILIWSYQSRWRRPEEPQMIAYFERLRRQVVPEKVNVETWFQLLDAEEGRL
jgi:hypothetical protein